MPSMVWNADPMALQSTNEAGHPMLIFVKRGANGAGHGQESIPPTSTATDLAIIETDLEIENTIICWRRMRGDIVRRRY